MQCWQGNIFSPFISWDRLCNFRWYFVLHIFPHSSQVYFLVSTALCCDMCADKSDFRGKYFSHLLQLKTKFTKLFNQNHSGLILCTINKMPFLPKNIGIYMILQVVVNFFEFSKFQIATFDVSTRYTVFIEIM